LEPGSARAFEDEEGSARYSGELAPAPAVGLFSTFAVTACHTHQRPPPSVLTGGLRPGYSGHCLARLSHPEIPVCMVQGAVVFFKASGYPSALGRTIRMTNEEAAILTAFAERTGRTKTDIARELIRSLETRRARPAKAASKRRAAE
jgi:hypothetical protein